MTYQCGKLGLLIRILHIWFNVGFMFWFIQLVTPQKATYWHVEFFTGSQVTDDYGCFVVARVFVCVCDCHLMGCGSKWKFLRRRHKSITPHPLDHGVRRQDGVIGIGQSELDVNVTLNVNKIMPQFKNKSTQTGYWRQTRIVQMFTMYHYKYLIVAMVILISEKQLRSHHHIDALE